MSRLRTVLRKMNIFEHLNFLEPEDPETLSPEDKTMRRLLAVGYRATVAVIVSWHVFDFLFSSIWMHGYIWSLNLPIDLDMSDKSAGSIVYHQLDMVGKAERLFNAITTVLSIGALMVCGGFGAGQPCSVWRLFRLSCLVGILTGTVRTLQMKQRLFSSLHEGFYCYFATFVIGLVLSLNSKQENNDKHTIKESEGEKEKEAEVAAELATEDDNNNNVDNAITAEDKKNV